MTALNVILSIRSRLRDEDRLRLRFSDEELRVYLEIAQNALILEFDSNIQLFTFSAESQPYEFYNRVLAIVKVLLNGTQLPNRPQTYALQEANARYFYLTSPTQARLSVESSGELKVYANLAVRIPSLQSELFLDEMFFNALVLGVLKQMVLVETSEDNLQKTAPYENFYKQEIARLYTLANKSQSNKIHYTKFIKC